MLKVGEKAPEFDLINSNGEQIKLSDLLGKKVVVYFYIKDNTAGCAKQAVSFGKLYDEFQKFNTEVVGISKDSVASHHRFVESCDLPFILLSDPELTAIKSYDVWHEKHMCGKPCMGVIRTTYLIDENGIIEKVWEKVKTNTNVEEILEYLEQTDDNLDTK